MTTSQAALKHQIAADLREQITTGTLGPGAALPTEPDLMREYRVSRGTAREALAVLEREGLIEGWRPRRVREHRPVTVHVTRAASRVWESQRPTPGADSWQADMAAAGRVPGQDQPQVRVEPASAAIAWRLRELEGADVAMRELLRTADGKPHNLVRFAFPMAVAAGTRLMGSADIGEGSVAYLAELGHEPVRFMVEIEPRMPSQHETAVLAVPPGVPVARVYRTGLDAAECPVYVEEAVWPGDRALLALEVE